MKNHFSLLLLTLSFTGLFAQNTSYQPPLHQEIPNDAYILVDRANMERSSAYNSNSTGIMTRQVNVDGNGENIVGDAANEPSIAVDPTNPNRMVIGWRQFDTIASDFREAGYGYSLDGGETWTFPGVLEPHVFRSDPVMDFDANGNFYFNSLTVNYPNATMFSCDVFKIDDGGVNWNAPVPARGGDKAWMRLDRTNGIGAGNVYSQWTWGSVSDCDPLNFTRSTDGAMSFEKCSEIPNYPLHGTIAVNADGDVYQSGWNKPGIFVQKSVTAKDPSLSVTWEPIAIVPLGGNITVGGPNGGLLGHIWVDVDVSTGPGAGNVYVLATVERDTGNDPADVMFSKSIDGGQTFSVGQRINTDPGELAYQWFGTLSVAPNGRIDVVWLDTRDATPGTFDSVLYYSFSEDEGESWSANTPISESFDPQIGYAGGQTKIGDYFDMVSDNNYAHLSWANTFTGGQDVYYTQIIPESTLLLTDNLISHQYLLVSPNPINETTTVSFRLEEPVDVLLEVIDIHGRKIYTLLDGMVSGDQSIPWNREKTNGDELPSGIYFVRLTTPKQYVVAKVVLQ
jgi:Secretion system C-terminal sorting domain